MKVRCNWCMSVFDEQYVYQNHGTGDDCCPCCGILDKLMDVPESEFPQYYNHESKRNANYGLPSTYAEIEYDDFDSAKAIEGARWDDANYLRYMER